MYAWYTVGSGLPISLQFSAHILCMRDDKHKSVMQLRHVPC